MAGKRQLKSVVPGFVRNRYARRLAVVAVVVLIALSGVGGWIYVQTGNAVAKDTQSQMTFSAESQARELSQTIKLLREEGRLLSQSLADTECSAVDGCPELESLMNEELREGRLPEEVVGVHYIAMNQSSGSSDPGGPLVLESTVEGFAGNEPDRLGVPWARGANRTKMVETVKDPNAAYVSQPWMFQPEGKHLSVFAVVSRVPEQKKLFVIMVSAKKLSGSIHQSHGGGFATVVDGTTGKRVLSHHAHDIGTKYRPDHHGPEILEDASVNGSGYTTLSGGDSGDEHSKLAVGYAPVAGTDWVVTSHVPKRQAFAVQHLVSKNLLLLLGVAAFGLGFIVLTIGRRTSNELVRISHKASELEAGNLDTTLESNRSDEFGDLYDAFDSMRDSLQEQILEVERAHDRTERIVDEMAADYRDVMRTCASGDLSARMDPESDNEAMQAVGEEFNEMMDQLEVATAQLREFAADVTDSSRTVDRSIHDIGSASQQMSRVTERISEDARTQDQTFKTVSEELSELSATTEEIAAKTDNAAEMAERNSDLCRQGRDQAKTAIDRMQRVASEADESVEKFERLEAKIEAIDEVTAAISEFAEQTNVLALNANIEASRNESEEATDGFGVVAAEIKDLAAEVKASANETEKLLDDVRAQTRETADVVRETSEQAQESVEFVRETTETFNRIAQGAQIVNESVQDINDVTDQQSTSTQEVVVLVEEAADISEQTFEQAQGVANAAQNQTEALEMVTRSVQDLSTRADELKTIVSGYDTRSVEELPDASAVANNSKSTMADGGRRRD